MPTPDALYAEFDSMVATPQGNRKEFFAIYERDLVEEDLILAQALPKVGFGGVKYQRLKNIRASHHEAARLVALGKSDADVALITGYTPNRVATLRQDPAFQELMAHYGAQVEELYVNVAARIAGFTNDAMEVLHERLLDQPDKMRTRDLKDLIALGLDRTGFGPKSTINTNIKAVVVTNAELERIKAEARGAASGAVRQLEFGTSEPSLRTGAPLSPGAPSADPRDSGSALGGTGSGGALEKEARFAPSRDESEGNELREEIPADGQLEFAFGGSNLPLPMDSL